MGTGVLIHVGDGIGWSIGCQIAPAADFDKFVSLVGKLGAKSEFRYALVEAQHLPAMKGATQPTPGAQQPGNAPGGQSSAPSATDAK